MKKVVFVLLTLSALAAGLWAQQQLRGDFSTLDGQTHSWDHPEGNWQVINYFAEWCAPCLREIPELNQFYQLNNGDIQIYAVSFDPLSRLELQDLQKKYAIEFPIIEKLDTLPWTQPPSSLPTTYILDGEGKLQKQLKGEQSAEKLLQVINLLKGL